MQQILDASRNAQRDQNKFLAALKGIDLDKQKHEESAFEKVKKRAEARLRGMTEEELDLSEVGIAIEMEDE